MADKVKLAPNIFSYPDFEHSNLHMEISLGGVKKEDITLKVSDGESCYCSERYTGSFQRNFRIPGAVDKDNIEAKYRDGILRVNLAKSGESVVKKIEIH
jgi:HSP20 family protein